jgi:hypothetical protein
MSFPLPIHWQEGDPAWVRGRRVTIVLMPGGGGVLVRAKDGVHHLVHRRDLDLPPHPSTPIAYVNDVDGPRFEVRS